MLLFTKAHEKKLGANLQASVKAQEQDKLFDPEPVVKLFDCHGPSTWLISEWDEQTGMAFGLSDLGQGFPELGYVWIDELKQVLGMRLERDAYWTPKGKLSEYASKARANQRIVELDGHGI
jgi:hypothetical protein